MPADPILPLNRKQRLPRLKNPSACLFLPLALLIVVVPCVVPNSGLARDWPQINGPNRNGTIEQESLLKQWPTDNLEEVWSHPVGQGYSGPVVVGNTVVVFHRPGKQYLVEALESKTGKLIWNQELPAEYRGGGPDGDTGPKSVPLIFDGRIYLFGTGGNLFCLSLSDGEVLWQKNVLQDYQSPTGYFGAGSSPIIVDNKLMINVGGKDAAVVAFDPKTGDEIWKSFDDRASYSSPIEMMIGDSKVAVFITRLNLIGLDPADGTVLFQTPFGARGPTVNGAMPVQVGDHIFINSAYGVGARWIDLADRPLNTVWKNDSSFSSQYSTPVLAYEKLYGTAGREDMRNGSFRCIEPSTGKVLWEKENFPVGHTLLVDKKLLVLDSSGGFYVIEPNETKFELRYQTRLFDSKSRAMPAVSNGLLYARSNANGGKGELICVRIGTSK